ncbi:MAG TPA: PIN domain-containing protein [Acidimicrobiales bacterium]
MSRYLVDNSILQRLPRSSEVQIAVGEILSADHELCCCALTLDEFAFSARSAGEHAEGTRRLRTSFLYLPSSALTDQVVIDIRSALWQAGKGRSAGVIDVAIAATAVSFDAVVLHYDSDFDHIVSVYPQLSARWVVPRGSID